MIILFSEELLRLVRAQSIKQEENNRLLKQLTAKADTLTETTQSSPPKANQPSVEKPRENVKSGESQSTSGSDRSQIVGEFRINNFRGFLENKLPRDSEIWHLGTDGRHVMATLEVRQLQQTGQAMVSHQNIFPQTVMQTPQTAPQTGKTLELSLVSVKCPQTGHLVCVSPRMLVKLLVKVLAPDATSEDLVLADDVKMIDLGNKGDQFVTWWKDVSLNSDDLFRRGLVSRDQLVVRVELTHLMF